MSPPPPLDLSIPTALLLIDNQAAFKHTTHWGTSRSNPLYEANMKTFLSLFRAGVLHSSTLEVIHVFHSSTDPASPLHPSHPSQGTEPLEFAFPDPDGSEPVFWKSVNSAFIGTDLESHLREHGTRQLIVTGLTTDHCVSTTVRMAANLGVVDHVLHEGAVRLMENGAPERTVQVDKGRIVLVSDATATFAKGGFDAETVHQVSAASLDGEFADVMSTEEVVHSFNLQFPANE